jgi:hypothetical protein
METEGQLAERLASYSDPPDDWDYTYPGWYMSFDLGDAWSSSPCLNPVSWNECTCGAYDEFGPYKTKAGLLSAFRGLQRQARKIGCSAEVTNQSEPWKVKEGY